MAVGKTLFVCAILLGALGGPAFAGPFKDCKEPEAGSNAAPVLSPPMSAVVTGKGRLQFYSAPNAHCPAPGVFVVPRDELIAYVQTDDGWTSVMYTSPKTGDYVTGWVSSARLKMIGTMGPKY